MLIYFCFQCKNVINIDFSYMLVCIKYACFLTIKKILKLESVHHVYL